MTITLKALIALLLGLLLLSSILLNIKTQLKSQHFGLVDIQALVSKQAETLARLYPDGKVPLEILQTFKIRLQTTLQHFSEKNRVILFAKEAVYGSDCPDYTQTLQEELDYE